MHSWLRLSCGAGNQVASHEKHKQVVVVHCHQYQDLHCGLRKPAPEDTQYQYCPKKRIK